MDSLHNLHRFFEAQVEKNPNQIAVIDEGRRLTYKQLNQKANQLAHYLVVQGVEPETLVAVFFDRSIEFLIAILGILKAGGAYIPLDTSHPTQRLALILKGAGNPLLITSSTYLQREAFNEGPVLIISNNEQIDAQPQSNPDVAILEHHLAYVIYTSGSTGVPKGVLIEHGAVLNYALWFAQHCDTGKCIDFSANPAFDFAVTLSLVPLVLGLTVHICGDVTKKDPRLYLQHVKKNHIEFIKLTPSYFKVLIHEAQNNQISLPDLKAIMLGGENLSKAECLAWLSFYPHHQLYNEYGPTETTVAVTAFCIDHHNVHLLSDSIPIGALAPNTEAYILDGEQNPVPDGETGELYLGGVCLARGYLNSPELTQRYFIKNQFSRDDGARLYKTGDLCRRTRIGDFECLGRIDHQFKIRGFRVEPDEVENCLAMHPAVKSAAVVVCSQYQKEQCLVAYYILKNPKIELKSNELIYYLKRILPDYMIPAAFIRMDFFPLNANDKLDRAALPTPQFSASQHYVSPSTRLEKMLVDIWSEELGLSPIGIKDNFFELGGHSLSAARIISKINHQIKKDVSLQDFYRSATIAALIPIIKKGKVLAKKQKALSKRLNNDSALFPLSDFQLLLWLANTFEPKAKKLNIFTRKRFQGRLDVLKLNQAFEQLLKKHEVLSFHPARFRPGQYLIQSIPFRLKAQSLESSADEESILEESARQLMVYHPWPKSLPQIRARLFYLHDGLSELQLCIPHIISDDVSPEILLSELSSFYKAEQVLNEMPIKDNSYRNYLLDEQGYLKKYLDRDIDFWAKYLDDAYLYTFPTDQVIQKKPEKNYLYSTYLAIQETQIQHLNAFCATNHISVLDGLCAVVALALKNCAPKQNNMSLCINRVKSTRNSRDYDNTIGCFLRIEPIKLALHESTDIARLSHEIHNAVVSTSPYQGCPNLVKLASIGTFKKEKKRVKQALLSSFFWFYSMLFQVRLYYKILRVVGRLDVIQGADFLININVQSNFLSTHMKHENDESFGFQEESIPNYQHDLLTIDNLFDASFLRFPGSKVPFLVISANLVPAYREQIANEMIRIMQDELVAVEQETV